MERRKQGKPKSDPSHRGRSGKAKDWSEPTLKMLKQNGDKNHVLGTE
jgi:hypothetical protein